MTLTKTTREKLNKMIGERFAMVQPHFNYNDDILEVSPLFAPLTLAEDIKSAGAGGTIEYCDYLPTEVLRAREETNYGRIQFDVDVMDMDFVWRPGQRLSSSNGGKLYDCVSSSHVAEHIPDLLGHLIELHSVLRDGGRFVFVLPNARGTAEYFRELSRSSDLIEALFRPKDRSTPGQVWSFFTRAVHPGEPMHAHHISEFKMIHTVDEAMFNVAYCQEAYVDVHCWAFTPTSFERIFQELNQYNLSPIAIEQVIHSKAKTPDGDPLEFLVIGRKSENFRLPDPWKQKYENLLENAQPADVQAAPDFAAV